jgi:site-specific recombinase XerD
MQALELFLSSIRSPMTRDKYSIYFNKYQEFIGFDDLFCGNNSRLIEQKIIEYLTHMKNKGKGYSTIHNYAASILAFYKINDVSLNITKINKFIPVVQKVRKDRAYTHVEIAKLLEIADERSRVIILLMTSSGIRVGALPLLRLGNLEDSKLIIYENDREEYFTFITPECQKAIDAYLDFRTRYGEKLGKNSPLVREQFNTKDPFHIKKPRQLTIPMINWILIHLEEKAGIRTKEVTATHGFRKFFTTQVINAKVNPEIREMLLGHKIGLASAYYRPTDEEMYQEYLKAVDLLTINEENRLKRKVHDLSNKTREDEYIIRAKLNEKEKEIEGLKELQSDSAEAITVLSDRLTKALEDIELLKQKK